MSHPDQHNPLFVSIKQLIEDSKQQVAVAVNATMSMLYWRIGFAINEELKQYDKQQNYGKQIVATLWRQLQSEYGTSFSEKNLRRMMQFAEVFPDEKIVVSLIRQLSWSQSKLLIPFNEPLKRESNPSQEILKEKLHKAIAIATSKNQEP